MRLKSPARPPQKLWLRICLLSSSRIRKKSRGTLRQKKRKSELSLKSRLTTSSILQGIAIAASFTYLDGSGLLDQTLGKIALLDECAFAGTTNPFLKLVSWLGAVEFMVAATMVVTGHYKRKDGLLLGGLLSFTIGIAFLIIKVGIWPY
jgi:hypothetical protein